MQIGFSDGTRRQLTVPAETWIQQGTAELQLSSTRPVTSVIVDPDHLLPDRDRANNVWPRETAVSQHCSVAKRRKAPATTRAAWPAPVSSPLTHVRRAT